MADFTELYDNREKQSGTYIWLDNSDSFEARETYDYISKIRHTEVGA